MIGKVTCGICIFIAVMEVSPATGQNDLALLILDSDRGSGSVLLSRDDGQDWSTQRTVPDGFSVLDITDTGWLLLASKADEEAAIYVKSAFSENISGPIPIPRQYQEICLSPQANQVVYIADADDDESASIYHLDLSRLEDSLVLRTSGDAASLSWSGDGQRVAFYVRDAISSIKMLGYRLYIANLNLEDASSFPVTPPSLPTRLAGKPLAARWSPDNQKLLFEAVYEGVVASSYVVADDGAMLLPAHGGQWIDHNSQQTILQKPVKIGEKHTFVFAKSNHVDGEATLMYFDEPLPERFGIFAFTGTSDVFAIAKIGGGVSIYHRHSMDLLHTLPMRSPFAKWITRHE